MIDIDNVLQPEVTDEQLRAQQHELCLRHGMTVKQGYEALARGEYNGTIFASEMSMLRFMLGESDVP